MKKSLVFAGILFAATNSFASSINIDVDLGGIGNILEHTDNAYYKAFYDDNGALRKSDMRLRGAKNATIKSEFTRDGINEIFNLTRGTLIPSDPTDSTYSAADLVSTKNPGVIKKDFDPGIQIYSSNNIQIKRGYIFSQEFLKFFNTNLLFEGVKGYTYTKGTSDDEEKIKNATLLLLLDKFNIRSFSMYYDDNMNNDYNSIINGLSNLEAMVDDNVKEDNYRKILKNKIHTIKILFQTSKEIYDSSKNEHINIKRYKITGNNKIGWDSARSAGLLDPYIEVFSTNAKDSHGNPLYAIDRTHIKYIRTNNSYCKSYSLRTWWGAKVYHDKYGYYYYDYYYGSKVYIDKSFVIKENDCDKTARCSINNIPPANASNEVKKSYSENCFYSVDVNTVKTAVKNVLDSLNDSYGKMVNQIFANTAKNMKIGTGVGDVLKYLTNNIPNLTNIMLSVSQSYAIRNVNALYRKNSEINMLDFMDDIQEVIGLKQYRYNKDLNVVREYATAISLSDFSDNSIPKIDQDELTQKVNNAIETSEEIANNGDTSGTSSENLNSEDYTPITPSNFVSKDESLAAMPFATTSDKAVTPNKMLIIYLNSFDSGGQSIIFGRADVSNLLNQYLTTNFDSGVFSNYDIFGYGQNSNNEKYYLGKSFLTDSQKIDYLKNSFALFGSACTDTGNGEQACTLEDRNVGSADKWIDIGVNNISHLYDLLISKIGALNNVNINNKSLIATLNEVVGILVDTTSGDSADKLVSILNGDKDSQNKAMKVDTFMPFKGEGVLVQTHYELRHYKIEAVTKNECDDKGTNCTEVITGYKWVLDSVDYPNYSCNAAFVPTSQIGTMLISKIYGNYVDGEISTTNIQYKAIGTTPGFDFAKLLSPNANATNEETIIGGSSPIPYSFEELANPKAAEYAPSDEDCVAHGFQPGCSAKDIQEVVNCADMGEDDFWNSHAVIYTMNSINIAGVGSSKLAYRNDYEALNDKLKSQIVDPQIAEIYSFDGKMPGIGDGSGLNDVNNPYKTIFLDGIWKKTIITNTINLDTGNNNSAGVIVYDCDGVLQTTMCSDSQLPQH